MTLEQVIAAPCANCGCGSYCHWDDLHTPPQGMKPVEWMLLCKGIECQRCPCKGYALVKSSNRGKVDERK